MVVFVCISDYFCTGNTTMISKKGILLTGTCSNSGKFHLRPAIRFPVCDMREVLWLRWDSRIPNKYIGPPQQYPSAAECCRVLSFA